MNILPVPNFKERNLFLGHPVFVDFSKAFDSVHRGKLAEILKVYGIPKETVDAIMMLYKDTQLLVRSPDGDIKFLRIVAGVFHWHHLSVHPCTQLSSKNVSRQQHGLLLHSTTICWEKKPS